MEVFEDLASFRVWISGNRNIPQPDGDPFGRQVKVLIQTVSSNQSLYPEHGWQDFESCQFSRRFFHNLVVRAKQISHDSYISGEEIPPATYLLIRHLRNLVSLLRIEVEADYHAEDANVIAGSVRSLGAAFPYDDFPKFCEAEANYICPDFKNRAHRLVQGETLADVNNE
jgi:hypothetical protein